MGRFGYEVRSEMKFNLESLDDELFCNEFSFAFIFDKIINCIAFTCWNAKSMLVELLLLPAKDAHCRH